MGEVRRLQSATPGPDRHEGEDVALGQVDERAPRGVEGGDERKRAIAQHQALRGGCEVVPRTGNTDGPCCSGSDQAVDAIVERGDQRELTRNVRWSSPAGAVDSGEK